MPTFSNKIEYVRRVCTLTGKDAVRSTEACGVTGTDLGLPFTCGDDLMLLFGDTFSEFWQKGRWINNCLARAIGGDPENGLEFLVNGEGLAHELVAAEKIDKKQMTCIPTGAVCIEGVIYLFVMSIVTWIPRWTIDECALYISKDQGKTFVKSETVRFSKEKAPNFGQVFPLEVGEYVYLFGVTESRDGACKLARVRKEKLDIFEEYEYYIGSRDNDVTFVAGSEGLRKAHETEDSVIIPSPCGEMCVAYNEARGEYLTVYLGTDAPDLVLRTAKEPWGPWSDAELVALQSDYPGIYGGFTHARLLREEGRVVRFLVSEWQPYNVSLFEMKFKDG